MRGTGQKLCAISPHLLALSPRDIRIANRAATFFVPKECVLCNANLIYEIAPDVPFGSIKKIVDPKKGE